LSVLSFQSENSDFEAVFSTLPASASRVWGSRRGLEGDLKIKRGAPADGLARLFDFAPTSKMPEL
jgi:hypothetical protein